MDSEVLSPTEVQDMVPSMKTDDLEVDERMILDCVSSFVLQPTRRQFCGVGGGGYHTTLILYTINIIFK